MFRFCVLIFLLFTTAQGQAQFRIYGRVLQADSKQPVAYASIGSTKLGWGTMSNNEGSFSFEVSDTLAFDTLIVSCLGFEKRLIPMRYNKYMEVLTNTLSIQLREVLITPLKATDYINLIVEHIPKNHGNFQKSDFYYYSERIKENNEYKKFVEIISKVEMPKPQSKDTLRAFLYKGRYLSRKEIEFMAEKKRKEGLKAEKKAAKNNPETPKETPYDPLDLKGGLKMILEADVMRIGATEMNINDYSANFFDSKNFSKYHYEIKGVTQYHDQTVIHIHFNQKKSVKEALLKGDIYFHPETYAVVALHYGISEYAYPYLIPGYLKAAAFVMGYKFEYPIFESKNFYKKQEDFWQMSHAQYYLDFYIEKRKIFSPNEKADFQAIFELVSLDADKLGAEAKNAIAAAPIAFDKALESQIPIIDKPFWKKFQVVRPPDFFQPD